MKFTKKILAFLLCIVTALSFFSSCDFEAEISDTSSDRTSSEEISETSSDTSIAEPRVISFGIDEKITKPMLSQRMASKTYSYFKSGEKIVVELFMGDQYSHNQRFGSTPSYDTYGTNGYPMMRVYEIVGFSGVEVNENSHLLFNGTSPLYEIDFSADDMEELDNTGENGEYTPTMEWHRETVEIDFSGLKPGDCGEICLGFGWFYYEDPFYKDPSQPDEPAKNNFNYHNNFLYYYVGENGIGLSYLGWETACKEAEMIEGKTFQTDEATCAAKPIYLDYITNGQEQYDHGSIISKTFNIVSSKDCDSYTINISTSDDITLVSENNFVLRDNSNSFTVAFQLSDLCYIGNINIEVEACDSNSNNAISCAKEIYCLHNEEYDYISFISLDSLACYSDELAETLAEYDKAGESLSIQHSNTSLYAAVSCTVKGTIRWTDSAGNTHPASNVNVEIYSYSDSGESLLATTSTNSSGNYSKLIRATTLGVNLFVRVKSSGLNINVQNTDGTTYAYQSSIQYNIVANDVAQFSYTANKTTNVGKAMSVHQAMALANRFIYTLEGEYLDNINVVFPTSELISKFDGQRIHILDGDKFDWDVIEHEYGHYVQHCFNITQSPGGRHYLDLNLADERGNKSEGIRLAWGEGWATYFAINLQKEMSASSMNIPYVGDTKYNDTDDAQFEYNIETLEDEYILGEANEATVAAILYDLTDPVNSADYDNVAFSTLEIWNITKNNHCYTLSNLITAIYNSSNYTTQNKLKIGETLSHFEVAAKLNMPPNPRIFIWVKQGGSTEYPNNYFTLVFYDSSYNLIESFSVGNESMKTLSLTQWDTIINGRGGQTVYCCLETRQTSSPSTGPYYSNLIAITIPNS